MWPPIAKSDEITGKKVEVKVQVKGEGNVQHVA